MNYLYRGTKRKLDCRPVAFLWSNMHAHPLCPVLSLSHSKKYFITLIFYEEREHDSFERNFRAQRTYGHACGTSNAKKREDMMLLV